MTDIKAGQKYRVRMGGLHPFSDGKTLEVSKIGTQEVYYGYEGYEGNSRHSRGIGEFEAFVRKGVLTLVEEAVAPVAAPKTTMVEIGARYAIGKHSGPFISNSEIEVTNVDKARVEYFYVGKMDGNTCTKDVEIFELLMRVGVIAKVKAPGPVKAKVTEAPTRAPTMPEAVATPYGNPFGTKPKSLLDVDYEELERHVVASGELVMNAQGMVQHVHNGIARKHKSRQEETEEYMQALSKFLKGFIGRPATRVMYEEILQACRMNLPSRFKPAVQFDENGRFVGVKIRDHDTTDSYYVPPECRPRSPAQPAVPPMPMTATGGILDNLATYCGLHREPGESDESLRNRIAPSLGKGASAPKVNEESKPAQPINKVEKTMSRIVNVFLFDNTNGLKADQRLIGKIENIATDGSNQQVLMEVAVNHDIGTMLKEHNIKRKAIVNRDILDRVGKTVYMQPIELSEVTYQVVDVVHSR